MKCKVHNGMNPVVSLNQAREILDCANVLVVYNNMELSFIRYVFWMHQVFLPTSIGKLEVLNDFNNIDNFIKFNINNQCLFWMPGAYIEYDEEDNNFYYRNDNSEVILYTQIAG